MDLLRLTLSWLRRRKMAWIASFFLAVMVAAMVVVTAVMAGFQRDIRAGLRSFEPDLVISARGPRGPRLFERVEAELRGERVAARGAIEALAPRARCNGLVKVTLPDGRVQRQKVTILGVDWQREREVLPWDRILDAEPRPWRRLPATERERPFLVSAVPGAIVGGRLAERLGLVRGFSRVGTEELLLATARRVEAPEGGTRLEPSNLLMIFLGSAVAGRHEHDDDHVYVSQAAWRDLRYGGDVRAPDATEVIARLRAGTDVEAEKAALARRHPTLRFESWADRHRTLMEALQVEDTVVRLMLFVIVALAGLLLMGVLSMLVREKRHDIGILRAMGMSASRVTVLFALYGAGLGGVSVLAGVVGGIALTRNLDGVTAFLHERFGFSVFDPSQFPRELPWVLETDTVRLIGIVSFALVLAIAAVNARRAGGLRVVSCLGDR